MVSLDLRILKAIREIADVLAFNFLNKGMRRAQLLVGPIWV